MASHKSFKSAAGLMLVAVLASRLLGFLREMIIAWQFGTTGAASAYTAAFNIPDLLYFFLSSGALSAAFIPVFTERFNTGRKDEAWEIFSIITCFMGLVLTTATIILWIYAKPFVSILAVPGFVDKHPELVNLTVLLTRIILPCQIFFFIGGVMMATLQSRQEFRATAAGPVIYNLGIIIGALVLSHWFNIAGVAMGTLIGAFAGNVLYAAYWMKRMGFKFKPSLNLRHPGVIKVGLLALPVIFGLGLPQIDVLVNKWFASFVSSETPAAMNYANRLMQVPLGIFAQAAGTAILPMLAAYAAKNAFDDMRSGIGEGLRGIMVESIPASIFMIAMADPLVRAMYMGHAFKASSVPATVIPLIWYSVGIFAWAGQAIVARGFFALQDTVTPVVIGTVSTVIFLPLNFFLMKHMGSGGIALATSIAVSIHFIALTYYLRKKLNGIEGVQTLKTVGKVLAAAAVMAGICIGVRFGMSHVLGSWQLQDGDLKAPQQFAVKLQDDQSKLSQTLYAGLSQETRQMLADFRSSDSSSKNLQTEILTTLNKQIENPNLFDNKRFRKASISPQLIKDVEAHPSGIELLRTNRLLLENTYPDAITKSGRANSFIAKYIAAKSPSRTKSAAEGGEWVLQESDIIDLPALTKELLDKDDPVSVFITSELPGSTREALKRYVKETAACVGLPDSLMHDINVTMNTQNLDPNASGELSGKALLESNRKTLESAYTQDVFQRPALRVESRMGSVITVLVAMLLAGTVYFLLLRLMKVREFDFIFQAIKRRFLGGRGSKTAEE